MIAALVLAIGLAVVLVDAWRPSSARLSGRLLAAALRASLFVTLAFALTSPRLVLPAAGARRLWIIDASPSMTDTQIEEAKRIIDAERAQPGGPEEGVIWAGEVPSVAIVPGADTPWPPRIPQGEGTDLGAAIQLAVARIDPAAGGRIVLLTDGRDTAGTWRDSAASAWALGIPIDVVPFAPADPPGGLRSLRFEPPVARPGGTVSAEVTLEGPAAGIRGVLRLELDGETLASRTTTTAGPHVERVEIPLPPDAPAGVRAVRATWTTEEGTFSRDGSFTVGPPPVTLMVSDTPVEMETVGAALLADGVLARHATPDQLTRELLEEADLVFLGDVAAKDTPGRPGIPTAWQAALRRWVAAGGGLVTWGDDHTYELGGWSGTPLGDVVPLDLAPESEDVEPAVALVHVLDTSASMGDWTGHHTKMALANEAAVASIRLMRPKDRVGVLAVSDLVDRVVALGPVEDPTRTIAAVRGIKPGGGGIFVYTALTAAEQMMKVADTPQRHVVLYADAKDAEEKVKGYAFDIGPGPTAQGVAARLKADGTTVSVIALGDPRDQDVPFLRDLARLGGGRFHLAEDPMELRAIFVEETRQVVKSVVHDRRIRARALRPSDALVGIEVERGPDFLGYVEVRARETATVVLDDGADRVVLATWQYGLGEVFAWSTDLGPRWGREWALNSQYPRLVVQLARAALRPPVARGADVETQPAPGGMAVTLRASDEDGGARLDDVPRAVWRTESGAAGIRLQPLGEGRWEGRVRARPGEVGSVEILGEGGRPTARQDVVVPETPEWSAAVIPLAEIARQTGGGVDAVGPPGPGRGTPWPLGPWLLALAAILLPVDAWFRRSQRAV